MTTPSRSSVASDGALVLLGYLKYLPGILCCTILAVVATEYGPRFGIPPMLGVIALGIGVRAAAPRLYEILAPGTAFCAKRLLRIGVALLGLRVVASDLISLGWPAILLVLVSLTTTVIGGYIIARICQQPRDMATIAATSVAVCGASAALAASSVVPSRPHLERDTALIIITVSILSTVVMLLYPLLAIALHLSPIQTSLLLGGAIHDVAQVVGAGFSISPEVGVQATTVKLLRVSCLLPVIMLWGYFYRRDCTLSETPLAKAPLPIFLLGFLALAVVASLQLIPSAAIKVGGQAAGWALTAAVAAIGLRTAIQELREASISVVATLLFQTLLQVVVVTMLAVTMFGD